MESILKLCYVIPLYDKSTSLHYNYNYQFVQQLGKDNDILVFIERAHSESNIQNVKMIVQKENGSISRLIERFRHIRDIRKMGYDTFYVHQSYFSALICSLVTKIYGGKVFYWHCGLTIRHPGFRGLLRYVVDKLKLRLVLKSVSCLVTGTPRMARYYQEAFKVRAENIRLVPNWVDLRVLSKESCQSSPLLKLRRNDSDKIILFIHDLSFRKGGHLLPRIIQRTCQSNPSVIFVLVGEGVYRADIERMVKQEKLAERVFLLGKIPNTEVPSHMVGADLFIMPSIEEGFPRVLLECMSTNVPFVATDVGGVLDIVPPDSNDSLIIVKSNDSDAFANAILSLLAKEHTYDLRNWIIGRFDKGTALKAFYAAIMR